MRSELKELYELFENERWLLIDGTLNEETVRFWREKAVEHPEIKTMLEEAEKIEEGFSDGFEESIDEKLFAEIIKKTIRKPEENKETKFSGKFFGGLFNLPNIRVFKPAFALFAVALAVSFYFFTNGEKSYSVVEDALLAWNDLELNSDIGKFKTKMVFAKDEDAKEIFLRYLYSDEWNEKVFTIQEDIKKLKIKISNSKL
ncbi:MAG: hypothetical protein GXO87_00410 [Chlorobi bacterium]|nr:hypothetical protein [Chlorobiota bacterium]